jgi:hypothetical protein
MKKLVLLFVFAFSIFASEVKGQMYHPSYANYVGFGTMCFTDYWGNVTCMYMGGIWYGRPNGIGYAIWSDGSFYKGGFLNGFAHGKGVVGNRSGYIAGKWNIGNFVETNNQYSNQDYSNTLSEVNSKQRSSNQNQVALVDPDGYRIEKLDPNSQFGETLLGKVGK